MPQQWNANFITYHLKPFLTRLMVDISKGEKPYLRSLIVKTDPLSPQEREAFEQHYFEGKSNDSVTPFTGPDDLEERREFITFLHEQIRSMGADPLQRAQAVLPLQDKENKDLYHFPPSSARNLYRLCYGIAKNFEKAEIARKIEERAATDASYRATEAGKDRRRNAHGLLILAAEKKPGQPKPSMTRLLRKAELKPAFEYDFFLSPQVLQGLREAYSNPEIQPITLDLSTPDELPSSPLPDQELPSSAVVTEFQARARESLPDVLQESGFRLAGPLQEDPAKTTVLVDFNGVPMRITVESTAAGLSYTFEYLDGEQRRPLTMTQEEFEQSFFRDDGTVRNFAEVEKRHRARLQMDDKAVASLVENLPRIKNEPPSFSSLPVEMPGSASRPVNVAAPLRRAIQRPLRVPNILEAKHKIAQKMAQRIRNTAKSISRPEPLPRPQLPDRAQARPDARAPLSLQRPTAPKAFKKKQPRNLKKYLAPALITGSVGAAVATPILQLLLGHTLQNLGFF